MHASGESLPFRLAGSTSSDGAALIHNARLHEAREAFKEAARLNPRYAEAYHGWGTISLELGDLQDACEQLVRATRLNRKLMPAWNNLALAAEVAGEGRLRRRAFRMLLRHGDWGGRTLYMRSLASYNRGNAFEAIQHFRQAYQEAPEFLGSFALLREQLEQERLALLEVPTFNEWASEYLSHRLTQATLLLGDAQVVGERALPRLIVGASVAAGVTLMVYTPEPSSPITSGATYVSSQAVVEGDEVQQARTIVNSYDIVAGFAVASDALPETPESSLPVGEGEAVGEAVVQRVALAPESPETTVVDFEEQSAGVQVFTFAPSEKDSAYSLLLNTCVAHESRHKHTTDSQAENDAPKESQDSAIVDEPVSALGIGPVPGLMAPLLFYSNMGTAAGGGDRGGHYNIKVGPMQFSFSGGLTVAYNDNVGLSDQKEADTTISASIGTSSAWAVTDFNTLSLAINLGYKKYMNRSDLDSKFFTIDPGSSTKLEFEVLLDNVTLKFYDSPSLTEDPFEEPSLSDLDKFRQFQNTAGVNAVWDLEDLVLSSALTHTYVNMLSTPGFSHLDRHEFGLSGSVSAQYRPWLNIGLTSSYNTTHFVSSLRSDSKTYGIGPNFIMDIGDHITLDGTFLHSWSEYDGSSGSNISLLTYTLGLTHELNELMNHSISFSRTIKPALEAISNYNITSTYKYNFDWNLASDKSLSFGLIHYRGQEELAKVYRRTDINTSLTKTLGPQTSLTASYGYAFKTADVSSREFRRNLISLSLNHKF